MAILIGVTISGVFSYINLARRNRDLHTIDSINTAASIMIFDEGYSTIVDELYNFDTKMYKHIDKHLYYHGCRYDFTPSTSGMTWDEYAKDLDDSAGNPNDYPATFSVLKKIMPDGVPKLETLGCELHIGIAPNKTDICVYAFAWDTSTYTYVVDGRTLSDDEDAAYYYIIFNHFYWWRE